MLGYIFPIAAFGPTSVTEITDQTHIFKCTVQTDNLFSIADHPGYISDKFTIIY